MYQRILAALTIGSLCMLSNGAVADGVQDALLLDPPHDPEHPAAVIELSIPSHGERLPGHLYVASGEGPHPTIVLLHGLPGNERNLDIAQALRRMGFNTLYFQYRGAWGATGQFRFTQLSDDAIAVLDYLREPERAKAFRVDLRALSVLGHSLGGFTALATGARDEGLQCVVSLSPANLALWKNGIGDAGGATTLRLKPYADSLYMLRGLTGERLEEELLVADSTVLDTTGFGPGLQGKAVLMMVGVQDEVTPAATMFDPVVEAYSELGGIDLTARRISGDHSFSWSRIALTREVLSWADARCR
ncbi:MAG: alpha/beta hydrolase family protein [Congregibacter sp.]